MSYYLRKNPNAVALETWRIDADVAVRIGVAQPDQHPGCYFKAEPGEIIWDAIKRNTPWFEPHGQNPFQPTKYRPGDYHPRIARPIDQHPHEVPGWSPGARQEANTIAIARSQLTVLTRQLDRICQTVHPAKDTFETYGHDIRNLLILACTEVETHWRGVLEANGSNRSRYTTQEYVALEPAMKLGDYAVTFPSYPWLAPIAPYRGWGSTGRPTQELRWYDAYNAVKHNREAEFPRATLQHAFDAVSACVIMMAAQFGLRDGLGQRSEIQAFFSFSAAPTWPASELYLYPYDKTPPEWGPIAFKFP